MDRDTINNLADLKVQSKILRGLVDTILDSCRLSYDEERLTIDDESTIFSVVKAFYRDEYDNRIAELKKELEEKRAAREESDYGKDL